MTRPLLRTMLIALVIASGFVAVTLLLSLLPFARRNDATVSGPSHRYINRTLGFTLQIPDGFQTRDEANGVVVTPLPTPGVPNPVPVMQVRVRPAGETVNVPAGSKVYTHAKKNYVVSLWRGMPWPLFDETAATLTFTK